MGMVVNHNIAALNTLRTLNGSNKAMSKSLQKLSSGFRINTGADGPADLVISEQLRAQTVGLQRAVKNTQEASNVIGIAEGALNELNSILKGIRSLALHASNSGVTSPVQIAADQSEVDSAIQSMDRIATTTKYSSEFLLNGAQELSFTRSTIVDGSNDHALVDIPNTRIDQISNTNNFEFSVGYTGNGTNVRTVQAARAYFEAYNVDATDDLDGTNLTKLDSTKQQIFSLTGNKGSKAFNFSGGTELGDIVTAINNSADSTGVKAQLITGTAIATDANTGAIVVGPAHAANEQEAYLAFDASAGATAGDGGTSALVGAAATGTVVGQNTDKNGMVYLTFTSATSYQVYKDRNLTMLVGDGDTAVGAGVVVARNSSGIAGLSVTAGGGAAAIGDIYAISVGVTAAETNTIDFGVPATDVDTSDARANTDLSNVAAVTSVIHGIDLGNNTDSLGRLYFEFTGAAATRTLKIYKNANLNASELVAQSVATVDGTGANSVDVVSRNNSGVFGTFLLQGNSTAATTSGFMRVVDQGIRLYSDSYGSDAFVKIDQSKGSMWRYAASTDTTTKTLLAAGILGDSQQVNGQDATLTINGQSMSTQGLTATVATSSVTADVAFRAGEAGLTTMAQQGYNFGGLSAEANQLESNTNYLVNARHDTSELLNDFKGGMQFQLGEGSGSQERTVYSIGSMATGQIGGVEFTDDFGSGTETKTLTLQDVLGGGFASLSTDPVKALKVIDKAIEDVSTLRARLGAFQKNLLETNTNSLNVAIENISATESLIRDADMAFETTQFTKNQILVKAGTSMLAQANVSQQNVLQLLG